jgi:hypothetical protein
MRLKYGFHQFLILNGAILAEANQRLATPSDGALENNQ